MISVDTSGLRLTDLQEAKLKQLFCWIANIAMQPDQQSGHCLRGNILIPFKDGSVGTPKVESFHDLGGNGNGNGKSNPQLLVETKENH